MSGAGINHGKHTDIMNNIQLFAVASIMLLLSGCKMADVDNLIESRNRTDMSFTAGFENDDTRTYVDNDLYMYWTADDRLSIFTSTYNEQYKFDGNTGDNGGSFSKVNTGQFVSGNPISANYGVYPYNSATKMTKDEKIELVLPATQVYAPNTFGINANTMVAVTGGTNDFFLPFKNVCGYLVVKLYGDGIVKRVIFEGNNGEKIAGAATVVASHNANPEITMSENATTSITIDSGNGIALGKTAAEATEFWFVIPPTTFSKGFTIRAAGDGIMQMKKSTTDSRTIQRNIINTMPAIEAVFDTPAEGNVPFADANFKAYCVNNFDKDHDGEVSYAEALAVTSIDVNTDNIVSLKGVECFENLRYLNCTGSFTNGNTSYPNGQLASLDVSSNTKLKRLTCYANKLTGLDVSKNTALEWLYCDSNHLSSLDVSKNTALTDLWCQGNQLTSLDVSKNTALTELHCHWNNITSLDVSKNTKLTYLWCDSNQLTSLDVSNNTTLTDLSCSSNQLTNLDVSKNTALTILNCWGNQLTSLDVNKNNALTQLSCDYNQLTSLDVSKNTALTSLYCYSNQLTSLDVSKNNALTYLSCSSNQLTSLDVSNNTALTYLNCRNNPALAILWMKRGQTISDLYYDSSITSIRYIDEGATASIISGKGFNTAIKRLVLGNNQVDYNSEDRLKVKKIVLNTSSTQTGSVKVSTPASESNIYLSFDSSSGTLNVNTIASSIVLPSDASYMFYGFKALQSIDNLDCLATGSVLNMASMFKGCSSLGTVDISKWDMSNVLSMNKLFYQCPSLSSVSFSDSPFNFNLKQNAEYDSAVISDACREFAYDISYFYRTTDNYGNVTDMDTAKVFAAMKKYGEFISQYHTPQDTIYYYNGLDADNHIIIGRIAIQDLTLDDLMKNGLIRWMYVDNFHPGGNYGIDRASIFEHVIQVLVYDYEWKENMFMYPNKLKVIINGHFVPLTEAANDESSMALFADYMDCFSGCQTSSMSGSLTINCNYETAQWLSRTTLCHINSGFYTGNGVPVVFKDRTTGVTITVNWPQN